MNRTWFKIPPPPTNSQEKLSKAKGAEHKLIPSEYIFVFKDQGEGRINNEVAREALQFVNNKISEFGIEEKNIKSRYEHALRGFSAKLTTEQLEAIKKNPALDFIEQDRKINFMLSSSLKKMNDTKSNLRLMSQTTPWGVTRVGGAQDGTGKKAWIIDTGIDLDHPDLNVDIVNSVSFVAMETANDADGHGTHVAGTIAAINNSRDVVGVAANASVVAVKVLALDPDDTEVSDVVDGVNYVAGKASSNDIVNMSLGAYDPYNSILSVDLAVNNAANNGTRFSIAAGNNGLDADDFTPARVNNSNVWTVSGYDINDDWYVNSNYGNPPIEYAGPAVAVPSLKIGGGVRNENGTSMAAPHIAGLLLMNSANIFVDGTVSGDPDSNPDQIVTSKLPSPTLQHSVYNNSPKLTWNSISGADEYKLYRKFETGSWVLVTTTTGTSYTDTPIYNTNLQTAGSPPFNFEDFYSYKVHAHTNSGAVSNPSNNRYFIYPSCSGPGCGS